MEEASRLYTVDGKVQNKAEAAMQLTSSSK